jgi:ceramide glucosyltransferase
VIWRTRLRNVLKGGEGLLRANYVRKPDFLGFEACFLDAAAQVNGLLACVAVLSAGLLLWQWLAAARFPLYERVQAPQWAPGLTVLKPLKGVERTTRECLRSWFTQSYGGPVQILFGVAKASDPVCRVVEELIREFPEADVRLIVCGPLMGTNLKVSKLVQLEKLAKHDFLVISDADVQVPSDCLSNLIVSLQNPEVGLVNCFYRLADPTTFGMEWEAVSVNADFWSQVLQARSLKPLDFALGAVMATRRGSLTEIGGFEALADCLADDYQLGNRLAKKGKQIVLSPVVVECRSDPMSFGQAWKHQLRWARTIRVCQPLPYLLSILNNATLWPLIWVIFFPSLVSGSVIGGCVLLRVAMAWDLQRRLAKGLPPRGRLAMMAPLKDLLQTIVWALAFAGNKIEWRGEVMRLRRNGTMVRVGRG